MSQARRQLEGMEETRRRLERCDPAELVNLLLLLLQQQHVLNGLILQRIDDLVERGR